jgi:hypothetical protein
MAEHGGWPQRRRWYLTWGLVVTIGFGAVGVGAWRFSDHVTAFGSLLLRHSEEVRNLTLSAGALAGVIVGLPLLWWRTWNVHRQAKAALRQAETAAQRHQSQAEADRERRITESFATAVELLGHEDRSVRLGAIYALERIARQNRDEHQPIMDTFSAYVRQWSERREREAGEKGAATDLEPAPADIQAAFTVLGRRRLEYEWDEDLDMRVKVRLDLTGAYLVGAAPDPRTGYSRGRAFDSAKLSGASLRSADLRDASFYSADLRLVLFRRPQRGDPLWGHAWLMPTFAMPFSLTRNSAGPTSSGRTSRWPGSTGPT